MKILYCEGNIDGTVGGSYFSLLYMVKGLDRSKYDPLVVFQTKNDLIPRFEDAGIQTMVVRMPRPLRAKIPDSDSTLMYRLIYPIVRVFQRLSNFIVFLPVRSLHLARVIRRSKAEMIHLNNSVIRNNDWMLAAMLTRTKCVTHERGINDSYPRISMFLAKRLDAIICISDAVKQSLLSGGVKCQRIVTIYNGIDPSVMKPQISKRDICAMHSITPNSAIICVIGNIKKWKGQETIIRAMPLILEQHPTAICLLVGAISRSDQGYAKHINDLIQEHGLLANVVLCGHTSNVADYIAAADVLVHTSLEPEPFGRVLIEAMSLSKPVVAAKAGAVPEVVKNGETGLMFEPGNHEDLSKKIICILGNPDLSKEMGRTGYSRVVKAFNVQRNSEMLDELYSDLFRA